MARLFVAASNNYSKAINAPATAVPLTMVCWARLTAVAGAVRVIMSIKDNAAGDARQCWNMHMASTEVVGAAAGDGVGYTISSGSAALVAGEWAHLAARFTSDTDRVAFVDGVEGTTSTVSRAVTGVNHLMIGNQEHGTSVHSYPWDGDIAEAAIYRVALSAADIRLLAAGASPLEVCRHSLVWYSPMYGHDRPEPDLIGNRFLVPTGTVSPSMHPIGVKRPLPAHRYARAIVAGGLPIPVAMHQYRRLRAA